MPIKILLAVSFISAFVGLYNMTWKTRRVPIQGLDRILFGATHKVEQYRKPHVGWAFFALAAGCFVATFFFH